MPFRRGPNERRVPTLRQDLVLQELDHGLVLYRLARTGIRINETAWVVLQLCKGDASAARIIDLLQDRSNVARLVMRDDVRAVLESTAREGITTSYRSHDTSA